MTTMTDTAESVSVAPYTEWLEAATTMRHVVPKRPPLPVLAGVLLSFDEQGVTLAATDYEVQARLRVHAQVHPHGKGVALVRHREFLELLKALGKGKTAKQKRKMHVTVRIEENGQVVVAVPGDSIAMPVETLPAEDYPTVSPGVTSTARVARAPFVDALTRASEARCTDETLPVLTGLHLAATQDGTGIVVRASDRFRLARAVVPTLQPSDPFAVLPPGRPLVDILKAFRGDEIAIGIDDYWLTLTCGHLEVSTRTLDADFPKTEQLIPPQSAYSARVARTQLIKNVELAQDAGKAKSYNRGTLLLHLADGHLYATPEVDEHGQEHVRVPGAPVDVQGIPTVNPVMVRADYLAAALGNFSSDYVTVHRQESPNKPIMVTEEPSGLTDDQAYRHLIMPVRQPNDRG